MKSNSTPHSSVMQSVLVALSVVVITVMILHILSAIVYPKNNQAAFGMNYEKAHGILGEPANSIDVLFIGNSEVYATFSPMQMYGENGFTSYVCATPRQHLPYSISILRRATEHQKPKVVVLETSTVYSWFSANECVTQISKDIFPIFEYHDRWKTLTQADITSAPVTTWVDDLKGFSVLSDTVPADTKGYMAQTSEVKELRLLNEAYLTIIIDYCRKIGAELILVSTPSTINWNMASHNGMAQYAQENNIRYLDLNMNHDGFSIDWLVDSHDGGDHLNFSGAKKTSEFMGRYLADNFSLEDHRRDERYQAWNEAYEQYCSSYESSDSLNN